MTLWIVAAMLATPDAGAAISPTQKVLDQHAETQAKLEKVLKRLDAAIPDTGPSKALGYVLEVQGGDKSTRGSEPDTGPGPLSQASHLSLVLRPPECRHYVTASLWVVQGEQRQRMPQPAQSQSGGFAISGPARDVLGVDWTGDVWVEAMIATPSAFDILRTRLTILP